MPAPYDDTHLKRRPIRFSNASNSGSVRARRPRKSCRDRRVMMIRSGSLTARRWTGSFNQTRIRSGPWSAAMDVGGWLRSLGLGQYEALFRASEIDADILPELTDVDLEKLGVPLGHRKRLLRAISGLTTAEPLAARSVSTGASARADAERRQLTVMFCDLVGSTPLSVRLDPEDLRGIIGAYHRCVAEIVEGFSGFVARYMGDGVLVYFGYPQAHEDDAERATRCGLVLV